MTSSLRRKRRITVRAAITWAQTAASVAGLFLGGAALAQEPGQAPGSSAHWLPPLFGKRADSAPKSLTYSKEPKTLNFCKDPTMLNFTKDPTPEASTFVPATPVPLAPAPTYGGIERTAMQKEPPVGPMGVLPPATGTPSDEAYTVQLEPPGPQRLYRLESERALQERMRQEALQRPTPERISFPDEPDVSGGQQWANRAYAPMNEVVEANYVCYGRLYFEERNSERFGWDLGFIQPFVSAGYFFKDLALLPYHMGTDPCRHYDCNSGYCLPGDPVPYVFYPPGLSVTGAVAEGATWVGIAALFP